MSMFSDMLFEEYEMLDEGKQADEYRACKAKEAQKATRDEEKHAKDRGSRRSAMELAKGNSEEDLEDRYMRHAGRAMASSKTARKHISNIMDAEQNDPKNRPDWMKSAARKSAVSMTHAMDAIDRHDRRKAKRSPKAESAIMLIEAYECDYIY